MLEQGKIFFGNMVNIALENLTFGILEYQIGTKFRAHECLFRALGTLVLRKFGHLPISQKVRGNTALCYWY